MSALRFNDLYPTPPFIWLAYDVLMRDDGSPEHDETFASLKNWVEKYDTNHFVISTQVAVGTIHRLEVLFPDKHFAYIPENFAKGEDKSERLIVGTRSVKLWEAIRNYFMPRGVKLIPMSPESAEMVKHALNGFLALSVEYAKEIAVLCRDHGATPLDVAYALMSDPRIGHKAYLKPTGEPGPHLNREVWNLQKLGGGKVIDALDWR